MTNSMGQHSIGPVTVEIVSHDRELLDLQPEWDALWTGLENPCYHQSFHYALACWQGIYKQQGGRLKCIVIRQSGRAAFIWPLVITTISRLKVLKPLGALAAEYTEPLVRPDENAAELTARAWAAVRKTRPVDIIKMPLMKANDSLYASVAQEQPARVEKDISYFAQHQGISTDWDEYFKELSIGRDFRTAKKLKRRLAEQGTIQFEVLENSTRDASIIDWCLQHKRKWAEKHNKTGDWLHSEEYKQFLTSLFATQGTAQRYAIFVLSVDGTPVAAKLAAYNKARSEGMITAYDPAWGKYSPGSLLDEYLVQWVFEHSLDLDFGVGTEAYKKFWSSNNAIPLVSCQLGVSPLGKLALNVVKWRQQWHTRKQPVALPGQAKAEQH